MSGECDRFGVTRWRFGSVSAAAAFIFLAGFLSIGYAPPAHAVPSFARQTGQPCGACHINVGDNLTPFGRRFKIGGYTMGGGQYRKTLFPSDDSGKDEKKVWVPPISMMAIVGFTNTQAPLPAPTAPYNANNNVVLSSAAFFWGGAVTAHIGALAGAAYSAPPPGGFTDPFGHTWLWDYVDVRYADSTKLGKFDVTYGITANNAPTVQDPWNTTPAWAFPYPTSTIAPAPATYTIINNTFGQHVVSAGAYVYIDEALYLEASAYTTLNPGTQNDVGIDPFGAPGLFDLAPYWRLAYEPHWGNNWLEVGTFGMSANVHPWVMPGTMVTATFPQTDKKTDIGIDSQYQYQGDNFWFTLRNSYIHEYQKLDASFTNGLAANPTNELNEVKAFAQLAYGNDNRVVLTGQYFNTWGSSDPILYGGLASGFNPNSNGWIAEIAYMPFISSLAPGWPWFDLRLALQYTWYNEFNGTSVGARNNNTLFLYTWFAM